MSPILRKALLATLLFLAAVVITGFFALQKLSTRFAQELTAAAAAKGASVSFQGFHAGPAGVNVEGLNVVVVRQKIPLSLAVDSLSLAPAWSSLFSGNLNFALNGSLYGGSVFGSGYYDFKQGRLSGTLNIENLDASRHPALRALGVTAGLLNVTLPRVALDGLRDGRPALDNAAFKLAITGLSRPAAQLFNLSAFLPVALPAFNDLNLEMECEGQALNVNCSRIESSSNLGTFNGKGGIKNVGPDGRISLNADISLSQDGQKAFGGFLPLLSGGKVPATQGIFAFELSGPLSRPRWVMTGY